MLLEKSIYCNEEILKEYLVIRIKILDIYEQKDVRQKNNMIIMKKHILTMQHM